MNNIIFHTEIEQKTEAWDALRLGKFTGSLIENICKLKGLGKTGESYINKKVGDILTGFEQELPNLKAIQHGNYYEPICRKFYSEAIGLEFNEVGFVENYKYNNCGASPDGLNFDKKIGIEIKCPETTHNHVIHLNIKNQELLKTAKPEYYWQIMFCMLITEFEQWKFISYHPNFMRIKDVRLYSIDIFWNQKDIDFLKNRIDEANNILEQKLEYIINL